VLAGANAGRLTVVAHATKSGFETAIRVPKTYATFELQALSSDGNVIGTSRRFDSPS
jgi:hypothetical protein